MTDTTTITLGLAIGLSVVLATFAAAWGGVKHGLRSLKEDTLRLRERTHAHGNVLAAHEARITVLEDKT